MITVHNFRSMLQTIGFKPTADAQILSKHINGVELKVDFTRESLIYPEEQGLVVNERQTCNFSDNENFVVFECVHRLLEKGYQPKHIELEKRWTLGHSQKSGRADISVYLDDDKTQLFMIIECKTAGKEYNNALKLLKEDGGQLFSYWQQDKSTQCLALYASDFDGNTVSFKNANIRCKDDANLIELHKKDSSLKLYQHARNVEELHETWHETYTQKLDEHLIFSDNAKAYNLDVSPLRIKDLKEFSPDDKIINQFEEILRHNAVSDKENAFNRLIALFICKLVDEEKDHNAVVDFQYKVGEDTYEKLQDRLQNLYRIGMEKFMQEEIFYVESDYVEKLFKDLNIETREHTKNNLSTTIRKLKYYTNNDFSFKDVHNEELFLQNGKILMEMVQLFEKYRISYGSKHQFLGDMFEQLLNKGFKQNEGQFFTPSPITRFIWDCLPVLQIIERNGGDYPKVIDYACGSGHFLTEAVEAINANKPNDDNNNDWTRDSIFGIEKDYRLARVSQVSMFMNGAGQSNIIFGDGLDNRPEQGIKNENFDILVANPPYSVSAFKSHLKLKNNELALLNNISNSGGEIEVLFCERIAQLLKSGGVGAVILPSSILSNDSGSYTAARELLLNEFRFRAIVNFGSKTFGATGANTAVLFLEKMNYPPKQSDLALDQGQAVFKEIPLTQRKDQEILNAYLAHIGVQPEIYDKLRNKTITWADLQAETNEYISTHRNAILAKISLSKTEEKQPENEKQAIKLDKFFTEFHRLESEKIALFALLYQQQTLIINAPSDNAKQKEFLGYNWSNRKGAEGIQILQEGGKLYNQQNRLAENTLAACVRAMFHQHTAQIGAEQQEYAYLVNSVDMIDFSATSFNKAIRTSVKSTVQITSKFPLVKLGDVAEISRGASPRPIQNYLTDDKNGVNWVKIGDVSPNDKFITKTEQRITELGAEKSKRVKIGDFILSNSMSAGRPYIMKISGCIHDGWLLLSNISNNISRDYLYEILMSEIAQKQFDENALGGVVKNLNTTRVMGIKIPLPPLEIQAEIVEKCEIIDRDFEANSAKVAQLRAEIENMIAPNNNKNATRYILRNLCQFNPSKSEIKKLDDNLIVSFVEMASVSNKGFIENKVDKSLGQLRKGSYTYFCENDVIIAKITPCMENGKCALATGLTNGIGMGSSEFHVFRANENKILPAFLFYSLNRSVIRIEAEKQMTGSSGHRRVPVSYYENLSLTIPDIETQRQIVAQIQLLEKEIADLEQQMAGVADAKKAILAEYL